MSITPPSRPRAGLGSVVAHADQAWQRQHGAEKLPDMLVLGVRGYYRATMGRPDANDRGIYDDAFFVVGPNIFAAFNANTDPSAFRPGIATLLPGAHWYSRGNHGISKPGGGYPAFRPDTPDEALPVMRDGQPGMSQGIAINIHKGGHSTTSSAGCQTVHPDQWDEFHAKVVSAMKATKVRRFPYILIDGPIA